MTKLDDELRRVLGREEPPAGFAERVLRRAESGSRPARRIPFMRWAAAAALVAAMAGAAQYRAARRERAAGEAAKEQVVQALQIAGSKLHLVQTKINRLHEPAVSPRESAR
jgi:hypothetical protein